MKETILLLALLILVGGCAVQEAPVENVSVAEDVPDAEPVPEPEITEEPVEEPVATPEVETFKTFNPTLKYPDAYNGPLYATSEQVGSASMDSYFKILDQNGINFFIGMFGISGEPAAGPLTSDQGLGEVIDAAQKHPYRVIPFFNPGIGGEEVEQYLGKTLTGWYKATLTSSEKIAGKGFIRGFGEVETQEWNARHNDVRVLQLINLAQKNNIHFMFHPVASKIGDVEKIIEATISIAACGILTYMVFWMAQQARKIRSDLEVRVEQAVTSGEFFAIVLLPFLSVFREGAETVLFLKAVAIQNSGLVSFWGGVSGFALAAGIAFAIFVGGKKIPLRPFFQWTGYFILLIAAGLLAYGIHELHELGWIPPVIEPVWNINHILNEKEGLGSFLKALFG